MIRSFSSRRTGVAAAVACSLLLAALPAAAQSSAKRVDIPAQALSKSLLEFSRQSGVNIVVDPAVVAGKEAPAVNGELTVEATLARLLAGSGLTAERSSDNTVLIKPQPLQSSEVLETINVFGTLENELSVGSKSGQSLRETPKSVTLVTRERIEAQNLTSLADVLGQATGVSVESFSPTDVFYTSRGFAMKTVQRDGGAAGITSGFGAYLPADTAFFERVEVLRGVDGMYSGAGEPGGVINLVRKRAKANPEVQANLSTGRWDYYRAEVDATGPLTRDGRLRGRVVGAYQDNGYFYERGQSEKTLFFATGEYDLTPSSLLIAGVSYERRKEDGYYTGSPRYSDGRNLHLPRDTNLVPDWSHWYFTAKEAFVRVEQKFGASGVIKLNLTRTEQENSSRQVQPYGAVDPITLTGTNLFGAGSDNSSIQNLLDLSASGGFSLFGREHRYTVGADYAKVDAGDTELYSLGAYAWPGQPMNVFAFDPSSYPEPAATQWAYYPQDGQKQHGFYATVGLQLAESLRLTLGGRYGEYQYLSTFQSLADDGTVDSSSTTRYSDSKFIPSMALSWDFAAGWTAYASYAETFVVQANLLKGPLPGTPLNPVTGGGFELGVKGEIFGMLNTAVALYRIERNNEGVSDERNAGGPGSNGSNCCFLEQAKRISEGVDAEVSGTVLPGWQLFAGYTFNRSKVEQAPEDIYLHDFTRTPKHLFKMWTTWQLPAHPQWTLNAGVVTQTSVYGSGFVPEAPGSDDMVGYRFTQGGYSLWNASVSYRLSHSWTIGLYGENLFDKSYYRTTNGNADRYHVYGTPRSYILTLSSRW